MTSTHLSHRRDVISFTTTRPPRGRLLVLQHRVVAVALAQVRQRGGLLAQFVGRFRVRVLEHLHGIAVEPLGALDEHAPADAPLVIEHELSAERATEALGEATENVRTASGE